MRTFTLRRVLPLTAIFAVSFVGTVLKADDIRLSPVSDPVVAKECKACHMLYPAGLLPARSWQALMGDLKNHFGENADLDEPTRKAITDYLTANAADANGRGNKMLRGLAADATPLRISELPYFLRKHGKKGRISPETLTRRGANWPGDCQACHRGAEQGSFDDD